MIVNGGRPVEQNLADLGWNPISTVKSAVKGGAKVVKSAAFAPVSVATRLATSPVKTLKQAAFAPLTITSKAISQRSLAPVLKTAISPTSIFSGGSSGRAQSTSKGFLSSMFKPTSATDLKAAALQVANQSPASSSKGGTGMFSRITAAAKLARPAAEPASTGVMRASAGGYSTAPASSEDLLAPQPLSAAANALVQESASDASAGGAPSAGGPEDSGAGSSSSFIDKIPGGKKTLIVGGLVVLVGGYFFLSRRGGGRSKS